MVLVLGPTPMRAFCIFHFFLGQDSIIFSNSTYIDPNAHVRSTICTTANSILKGWAAFSELFLWHNQSTTANYKFKKMMSGKKILVEKNLKCSCDRKKYNWPKCSECWKHCTPCTCKWLNLGFINIPRSYHFPFLKVTYYAVRMKSTN